MVKINDVGMSISLDLAGGDVVRLSMSKANRQSQVTGQQVAPVTTPTEAASETTTTPKEESTMSEEVIPVAVSVADSTRIKGVEYKYSYPNPSVTNLSASQTARAVAAFMASRAVGLTRQDVASEEKTLGGFRESLLQCSKMAMALGFSEQDANDRALAHCMSESAKVGIAFRLAPATEYVISLERIFSVEEETPTVEAPAA